MTNIQFSVRAKSRFRARTSTHLCSFVLLSVSVQWQSCCFIYLFGLIRFSVSLLCILHKRLSIFLSFSAFIWQWHSCFSMSGTVENMSFGRRWVWCKCVCVFRKCSCISDWNGSWSDPVHCHDRSLSSVLLNLVHPGVMFCSTSSTGKTGSSF